MTQEKKSNQQKNVTKKSVAKKKETNLKLSKSDETTFPHNQFPVKVVHKDGKDLDETKICYFQSESHAQKYIVRSKFTKKDYKMFIKPQDNKK